MLKSKTLTAFLALVFLGECLFAYHSYQIERREARQIQTAPVSSPNINGNVSQKNNGQVLKEAKEYTNQVLEAAIKMSNGKQVDDKSLQKHLSNGVSEMAASMFARPVDSPANKLLRIKVLDQKSVQEGAYVFTVTELKVEGNRQLVTTKYSPGEQSIESMSYSMLEKD